MTELEITRLDRALFDVPADFVEASSSAEIVPALATGGSLAEALFGSTVDGSSMAAPKKPGVIRIGVLEPINKTTRSLPTSSLRHGARGQVQQGAVRGHSRRRQLADARSNRKRRGCSAIT